MTATLVRVSMSIGDLALVVGVAFAARRAASILIDWWSGRRGPRARRWR
jgi:hypothetical protein